MGSLVVPSPTSHGNSGRFTGTAVMQMADNSGNVGDLDVSSV